MSEVKTDSQLVSEALKKMDEIVIKWFMSEPVLLGAWTMVDKIADKNQKTIGIDSKAYPPSIKFNPNFVNALPKEYLEAVMSSETFKILLKHCTTRLKSPKAISNMASQLTINSCIMGSFEDRKIFNDALEADDFDMESKDKWFEYYFRELLENLPKTMKTVSKMFKKEINENDGQKQPSNASGEQGDGEEGENSFPSFSDAGEAMKEYFDPSSTSNQDWDSNDMLDADVQNMLEEKSKSMKWGKIGGTMMNQIIAANTPKISWKDILRRFRTSIMSSKQTSSRMKVNRRYDLAQPGHKRLCKSNLIVGVDVSGSMSDEDLQEGFAVINSICRHSDITYVLFDTKITTIEKKFKKAKDTFKVTGRGGTNFQEIIDYANNVKSDGLIIFTDGEAPAPTKPDHTKVLWLLTSKEQKAPVEWGEVAVLDRHKNIH